MANKVNYYSWIHELNKSALMTKYMAEAELYRNSLSGFQISQNMRSNANQFINTAKNRNHSGIMQRHNLNEARDRRRDEIERPVGAPRRTDTIATGIVNIMKGAGIPPESIAKRTDEILGVAETGANFQGALSGMGSGWAQRPSIRKDLELGANDEFEVGPQNTGELQKDLANMRAARIQRAIDSMPRDVDGDGDADGFDVQQDAQDGIMGNETISRLPSYSVARQEGLPAQRQHPAPQFSSKEEAEAFVREINRRNRVETDLMSSIDDILDQQKAAAGRKATMGEMQTIARILGGG